MMKVSVFSQAIATLAVILPSTTNVLAQSLTDPVCNVLADNPLLLEFPSFTVPCPAVGERVNVAYSFRKTLRESSPDALAFTKAGLSMTVAHDGANPVAGISYGYVLEDLESPDMFSCDDLTYNFTEFTKSRTHVDKDIRTFCENGNGGVLSDVGGFCMSIGIGDAGIPEKTIILSAWNDGGCEGNMEIKAVVDDALTEDASLPSSVCLSPIIQVCDAFVNGTGGEPWDPSMESLSSAGSKLTLLSAIGLTLAAHTFLVGILG